MTQDFIMYLGREAILTVLLVSAPILGVSLLVGLAVSIFQATTQIQEQTLTFVPKIVAIFAAILFFGAWMMNVLIAYASNLFMNLHNYTFIR